MKILFVCLGNICRSPLAEGIMRHKLKQHKINIEVDSAGTGGWHSGEAPDKRAIAIADKNNVDISKLKARKFEILDFETFDRIYVMDLQNKKDVIAQAPSDEAKQKVELLLNILSPLSNAEVPDPWFGGSKDFEAVFELLNEACNALIKKLK